MYGNLPATGGIGMGILGYELGASWLVGAGIVLVVAGVAVTRIAARLRNASVARHAD